jgi:hypothetical protein
VDRLLPRLGDILLVVLAVVVGAAAVAVALGYGLREAPAGAALPPLPTATASPADQQVRALFVGGSVLAGASVTPGSPTVAEVAAVQLGWKAEVDGRVGAGFTVDGSATAPRLTRPLAIDIDGARPHVVVIQGGEADVSASAADLAVAVTQLATSLREQFGLRTRLVLVGPYSPTATPSAQLRAVRDTMKTAAKASSLHFFDPIDGGWVSANDPAGLVDTRTGLPTADGHLKLGRVLADYLETLRVTAPAA